MSNKWPTIHLKEGENPWVTYAKRQTTRKNNCINLIVTSIPGEGKSWGLLSYYSQIDPDFDLNEQCFFKAGKLMRVFEKGGLPKGKPFMFDEAGIDANSLKWQDEINKGLNAYLQTSRHRNHIFGMTVPFMSFVSKGIRTLMNCHWKAQGWNSLDQTRIKPLTMEFNGDLDKFYRKRLLIKSSKGFNFCDEIRLPRPPKNITIEYEKMKKEFTQNLYKEIADKIEAKEEIEKPFDMVKSSSVAKELGLTTGNFRQKCLNKSINGKKLGGLWYISKEERLRLLGMLNRTNIG